MSDTAPQQFHLTIKQPESSPVSLLADATGLSNGEIKQAMQKSAVWVTRNGHTQRLRRASKKLGIGDELFFYFNRAVLAELPTSPELIADEGDYSVWSKPFGMSCQGSKWGDHCTLYRWAEQHLEPQRSAFIVHRLDRAASGLILLAHSKKMAAALAALFKLRDVDKHYRVWVEGDFSQQSTGPWNRLTLEETLEDKPAISHVSFVEYDSERNRSLLDVSIETGRKHQIRRHLADAGFPVVGDRLYGNAADGDEDLQLTACRLSFQYPGNGEQRSYQL